MLRAKKRKYGTMKKKDGQSEKVTKPIYRLNWKKNLGPITMAPERKFYDVFESGTLIAAGVSPTLMNTISNGTQVFERLGGRYQITSVQFRLSLKNTVWTSMESFQCRVMVVHDRSPNGATFALTDLLQDASTQPRIVVSPYERENTKRFEVLYDHTTTVERYNGGGQNFNVYIPTRIAVQCVGNGGVISNINKGAVYYIIQTDVPGSSTISTDWNIGYRLRFVDA